MGAIRSKVKVKVTQVKYYWTELHENFRDDLSSNLSYLSKLIETTIDKQLWAHLKDVNVIPGNQSAYRENHSTETTVYSIMNDMIQMVSEGKCGILVGKCIQYVRIDFYMKKTKKRTKNDGSQAVIVIIVGGKTPDNHQQASGTCWEIGGFGWGKKKGENT